MQQFVESVDPSISSAAGFSSDQGMSRDTYLVVRVLVSFEAILLKRLGKPIKNDVLMKCCKKAGGLA